MGRVLTIDIGAGTMDILFYDTKSGLSYKSIVKSPLISIAEKIEPIEKPLLVVGKEMGGGKVSGILKEKAQRQEVIISQTAAATIHHNPEKVTSAGLKIVSDTVAETIRVSEKHEVVCLGDIEKERLDQIVAGFGIQGDFDCIGICAQDHGAAPAGVSHLDYRNRLFAERLDTDPEVQTLLYDRDEIPETLTRLKSISDLAESLPAKEIYVMDSGMAAILGACQDPRASAKDNLLVMDIATSHTLGAAVQKGRVGGFFEYHTRDITQPKLEELLQRVADGNLVHEEVLKEGGHGAYVRTPMGYYNTECIISTGPKRKMMEESTLPILLGAPLGDNMLTGAVGLLEAIRIRKGWNSISYI